MKTVGIVLAAGASQRMGSPKALLGAPAGRPLAVCQADVLRAGGCDPVVVVLGAQADRVRAGLPESLPTVSNPRWAQGRATSLQAAISTHPQAEGYLFLPVDTVGVAVETIRGVLAAAVANPDQPWRALYRGRTGQLLWLPRGMADRVLALAPEDRIDQWVGPLARGVEVEDAAILRNVNTPEEWEACQRGGPDTTGRRGSNSP